VGLAGAVATADVLLIRFGKATMSEVFGDALRHPARRWTVIAAWVVLSLHLFGNILPRFATPIKRYDPIGALARVLTPKV
jgi:hypothetical protein